MKRSDKIPLKNNAVKKHNLCEGEQQKEVL